MIALSLTVSSGVTTSTEAGSIPEKLLKTVDEMLWQAKGQGRKRVIIGVL